MNVTFSGRKNNIHPILLEAPKNRVKFVRVYHEIRFRFFEHTGRNYQRMYGVRVTDKCISPRFSKRTVLFGFNVERKIVA